MESKLEKERERERVVEIFRRKKYKKTLGREREREKTFFNLLFTF